MHTHDPKAQRPETALAVTWLQEKTHEVGTLFNVIDERNASVNHFVYHIDCYDCCAGAEEGREMLVPNIVLYRIDKIMDFHNKKLQTSNKYPIRHRQQSTFGHNSLSAALLPPN